MKKIFALVLAVLMIASVAATFSSCSKDDGVFRLGVILLHDEKSTYDLNFIEAVEKAADALGLAEDQVIYRKNIPETDACANAARELIDEGWGDKVLISNDICLKTMWKTFGGLGYAHILRDVRSMAIENGIDEKVYDAILTDNVVNFIK